MGKNWESMYYHSRFISDPSLTSEYLIVSNNKTQILAVSIYCPMSDRKTPLKWNFYVSEVRVMLNLNMTLKT